MISSISRIFSTDAFPERHHRRPVRAARKNVPADVDDIAHHRAARGHVARAPTIEHRGTDRVAHDRKRVENTIHAGDGILLGKHGRVHPRLDLAVHHLGDRKQLDLVSELFCKIDIQRRDLRDPLGIDIVELHRRAVGEHGEHRELMRRIDAFDIEGRDRPRHNPWPAPLSAPHRTSCPRSS